MKHILSHSNMTLILDVFNYVGRQGRRYFISNHSCDGCCDGVSLMVCVSVGVCAVKVLKWCSEVQVLVCVQCRC